MASTDPTFFRRVTYFTKRHAGYVTADPYFNRPARCSISLHKRHVYPRSTSAEAFGFGNRILKFELLIF